MLALSRRPGVADRAHNPGSRPFPAVSGIANRVRDSVAVAGREAVDYGYPSLRPDRVDPAAATIESRRQVNGRMSTHPSIFPVVATIQETSGSNLRAGDARRAVGSEHPPVSLSPAPTLTQASASISLSATTLLLLPRRAEASGPTLSFFCCSSAAGASVTVSGSRAPELDAGALSPRRLRRRSLSGFPGRATARAPWTSGLSPFVPNRRLWLAELEQALRHPRSRRGWVRLDSCQHESEPTCRSSANYVGWLAAYHRWGPDEGEVRWGHDVVDEVLAWLASAGWVLARQQLRWCTGVAGGAGAWGGWRRLCSCARWWGWVRWRRLRLRP